METPVVNQSVNKGGRPPKYTRETLQEAVEAYFSDTSHKPYSVLELCSELNITRETLSEWESNEDKGLSDIVTRAKYRIAAGWEKAQVHPKIGQFLLQNYMGMSERQTVEHTGTVVHALQPADWEAMEQRVIEARQKRLQEPTIEADFEVIQPAIQPDAEK